jgi:threonine aldolase
MHDTPSEQPIRQFASDTWAGLCPEALEALQEVNQGHLPAYGDDPWTSRATASFHELFDTECAVFFVPTGTAANALALAGLCQSYHCVFCHAHAHIHTDECGAPEFAVPGIKLVPLSGAEGKVTPEGVTQAAKQYHDVHSHKPGVLSLSQATEGGTVYSVEELYALTSTARDLGIKVHMDGARFANAAATLGNAPAVITWQAGIDVLCFGGTKNGLASGDALIFFDATLAENFVYRRKQAGHLQAKMRYVAAPWLALLATGAWKRNAEHANAMAQRLANELSAVPDVRLLYPVQANGVFVDLPQPLVDGLHRKGWHFYAIAGGWRLMCSFDTREEDIAAFMGDLNAILAES